MGIAWNRLIGVALMIGALPVTGEEPEEDTDHGRTDMNDAINWEPLLFGTDLDGWRESESPWTAGTWSREGETVIGRISGDRKSRIVTGDSSWTDYEYALKATLEKGDALQIHFRVSDDGNAFYMIDLWPGANSAVLISKRGPSSKGVDQLRKVDFPFEKGQEYDIRIVAQGSALSCYIDGELVNQHTDDSFSRGGVGLNLWHTTHARFRDLKIRHYR